MKELATCFIKYFDNESEAYDFLKKSYEKNFITLLDFADDADFNAMNILADIYYFSMPDTPENKLNAFNWCEKIAKRNVSYGYDLAVMYLDGEGVEKNLSKAFELFRQSAELGNSQAMSELTEIYLKGELVPKDESKN